MYYVRYVFTHVTRLFTEVYVLLVFLDFFLLQGEAVIPTLKNMELGRVISRVWTVRFQTPVSQP